MARVTPVLWKYRANHDGHHPLLLRVADGQRTLYASLGVNLHPRFWNDRERRVRKGHPNTNDINNLIAQRLAEAERERIRLLAAREPVTAEALRAVLADDTKAPGDFFAFADGYVEGILRRGKVREHRREKAVLSKLRAYAGDPLPFDRLTPRFLRDYETHLIEHYKNNAGTVNANFRVLRTILYRAIKEGHFPQERNPFFNFKPPRANKAERPKLTLEQVRALEALDLGLGGPAGSALARARDYFLFALYGAGIRFGDVAMLRLENLVAEAGDVLRLAYTMGKTGQRQSVALIPEARAIVAPYLKRPDGKPKGRKELVFPLLEAYTLETEEQRVSAVSSQNALTNKHLKELAKRVEAAGKAMPPKLTFHLARHSFADLARRAGWDAHTIKAALGHSSIAITEHYLAGFDGEALDGRMSTLFGKS